MSFAVIEWETPQNQREDIVKYIIKIPSINYVKEELIHSHAVHSNVGAGREFYDVEVIAVTKCGLVSKPAKFSLRILPTGKGILCV